MNYFDIPSYNRCQCLAVCKWIPFLIWYNYVLAVDQMLLMSLFLSDLFNKERRFLGVIHFFTDVACLFEVGLFLFMEAWKEFTQIPIDNLHEKNRLALMYEKQIELTIIYCSFIKAQWSGPSIVQGTVKPPKSEHHGMDRRQEATKSMEEKIKQVRMHLNF